MRRWWALVLGTVALLAVPAASPSTAIPTAAAPREGVAVSGNQALVEDLDKILDDPRLRGAQVGVVVRDPVTDRTLYSRSADERMVPASNAKLLTSVAALNTLGPNHRFRTSALAAAPVRGGVLRGDLYLRGTGDPTMLAEDYDDLAGELAESGISEVRGELVADDSWFDDAGLGNGWMAVDEPYYYAAPISALTVAPNIDYDAGTVIVRAAPTVAGESVGVRSRPRTDAVTIVNRAVTAPEGTESDLSVHRLHGSNRVLVSGRLAEDADPVRAFSSVADPTAYAADVFRRALARHGIEVRGVRQDDTADGARTLAEHRSMPLGELLVPFLKLSNNGHAEVLIKSMGRESLGRGSWKAGLKVLDSRMAELGIDPRTYRMADGSGLSTMDVLTANQLVRLLDEARSEPWFEKWHSALPIAGERERMVGGTLRGRMNGTIAQGKVHAKTGSMTGVSALSGYVRNARGRRLVFAVLFNRFLSAPPRELQDAVAIRLAAHPKQDAGRQRAGTAPRVPGTPADTARLECSWTKSC